MTEVIINVVKPQVLINNDFLMVNLIDDQVHNTIIGIPGPAGSGSGSGTGESYDTMPVSTVLEEEDSHTIYTNEGATALVIADLPPSAKELLFTFIVTDPEGFKLDAAGSDLIYNGTAVSTPGGTLTATKVGSVVRVRGTDEGAWFVEAALGVWKTA